MGQFVDGALGAAQIYAGVKIGDPRTILTGSERVARATVGNGVVDKFKQTIQPVRDMYDTVGLLHGQFNSRPFEGTLQPT
ncbi:MAG: hypothetical protein SFU25_02555 [Candidatus Caenarcaniphilales bacterium]|nr:hypothetical protein [Candidatus Caenarcaniphilales bacterium]